MATYSASVPVGSFTTTRGTFPWIGLGRLPLRSITGVANVRPTYGQLWPRRGQ